MSRHLKQKQKGRGAPRKKGKRLPTRDRWAASRAPWTSMTFDQYGLHGTFETKTRTGLYYTAGKDRVLKFVLSPWTRPAIVPHSNLLLHRSGDGRPRNTFHVRQSLGH